MPNTAHIVLAAASGLGYVDKGGATPVKCLRCDGSVVGHGWYANVQYLARMLHYQGHDHQQHKFVNYYMLFY